MKILALIPDPATAFAFGDTLATFPPDTVRVVAYGQATAAVLPASLDVLVYPLREGTRLPAPFLDALVRHEEAHVLIAPAGALGSTIVPALVLDLDPRLPVGVIAARDDGERPAWIEGVTAFPDRRAALLGAGLFCVDLEPEWFEREGRLYPGAADLLLQRLTDLAALSNPALGAGPRRPTAPVAESPAPEMPAAPVARVVTTGPAPSPQITAPLSLLAGPMPGPVSEPLPAPGPEPVPTIDDRTTCEVPAHAAARYRDRHAGQRVLVLGAAHGLDLLTPDELSQGVVVAVPDAMPWLSARMGVADYLCAAAVPRTLEAAAAVGAARTVLVHESALDGEATAPRARARVALADLRRAGGPALGWSDDMTRGFFPGGGDAALAVQWAHWVGAGEVVVVGLDPAEGKPHWPPFWRGAREILAARGIALRAAGSAAHAERNGLALDYGVTEESR